MMRNSKDSSPETQPHYELKFIRKIREKLNFQSLSSNHLAWLSEQLLKITTPDPDELGIDETTRSIRKFDAFIDICLKSDSPAMRAVAQYYMNLDGDTYAETIANYIDEQALTTPLKRGPKAHPLEKKIVIIDGSYKAVKKGETLTNYCRRVGISRKQLGIWKDELGYK